MAHSLLVVDDSPVSRKILRKVLPPGDFLIREASGGRECLELYGQSVPDLVFLDLTMPEMDGFQTLAALKELDPNARVVVLTADIQPASQAKALALGALQVLAKPPNAAKVKLALEKHLL